MTTKKLVIIIGGVLLSLGLVVVLLAASIFGLAFYFLGNSEAAETAKTFLKSNEKLRAEIGEVRDFGFIVTGSVDGSEGLATLNLKAEGARETVDTSVSLIYRNGRDWRVVDASYVGRDGRRIELVDKYGPAAEEEAADGEQPTDEETSDAAQGGEEEGTVESEEAGAKTDNK